MSKIIPPIPSPFGASSGNPGSPNVNKVDTMPTTTDPINTITTKNVSQSVVDENLPQLLDSKGGIIISCLPNDVMKSVIKCKTAKEMWNDLILAHEGPSNTRDTKIVALRLKFNAFKSLEGEKVNGTFIRLKCLLNNLENNGVTIPQAEVNATLVNSLPKKWLSMNQTPRANNSIKNESLATLYGKYNYEDGLIDQIYKSKTQRFTIQASSSKALISNHLFQDSDSDVKEDHRTNNEFMADLNAEFRERALLANQKRFYKRSGRVGSTKKPLDKTKETCFACGKLGSTKNNEIMEITEDEPSVGKANARLGQWVDITMKKLHILLSMTDGDERKYVLDYTHVDLHYGEDQRKNLVNKFNLLKQEISLHKSELSNLKNIVSINCSLQNEVIKTCSKVTLDQMLSEQLPGNIVKALGRKSIKKEKISSKEVFFTKADESSPMLAPEITYDSDSECDSQEPLPPLPKLISTDQLTKEHLEHAVVKKTLSKLKAQLPLKPSPKKAPMIPKPFIECKYYGFNDHHFDHYKFYPGCEVRGSIAHDASYYPKKHPNSKRPRIANKQSEPIEKHSKESGLKVVFEDDSSRDTKGYGSVNSVMESPLPGLLT
nr:hypothetical protein [Tanacetum cinerariifolium]